MKGEHGERNGFEKGQQRGERFDWTRRQNVGVKKQKGNPVSQRPPIDHLGRRMSPTRTHLTCLCLVGRACAVLREDDAAGAAFVVVADDVGFGVESFIAAGFPFRVAAMPASSEEEQEAFEEERNRRAKRTGARLSFSWRVSIGSSCALLEKEKERGALKSGRAEVFESATPNLAPLTPVHNFDFLSSSFPDRIPSPSDQLSLPQSTSMLASARMSTAQRPSATARTFSGASSSKPSVVAAPSHVANGAAAPARRSSTLICRAEPGELLVFFVHFYLRRERVSPFCICRTEWENARTNRTSATEENSRRADHSRSRKIDLLLNSLLQRRRRWPLPRPPPPELPLPPRPTGCLSSSPRTCRRAPAGRSG